MTTAPERPQPAFASRHPVALAAGIIALAAVVAYHNSLTGPLVFDDLPSIRDNPTIRELGAVLRPPAGMTVDARPVLNASLALNYAISGTAVWSYHAANIAIHILAGLTLFGIVRRTLDRKRSMGFPPWLGNELGREAHATFLAFAAALIWTVHPLQTESVTYIVQRAESLMGLFYLLTLYCFIRSLDPAAAARTEEERDRDVASTFKAIRPFWWGCFSVAACLLGMATKEVMASAPLIVLLYDRTFVSGSFGAAVRRHRGLYAALASTWIILALLAISSPGRGGSTGFSTGMGWWNYVEAQFPAIAHYLRLAVWPSSLVFYYGPEAPASAFQLLVSAAFVLGVIAATLAAIWWKSAWGFLGAWFFAILAPSSLVGGSLQTIAEHRMYLPLAAVVVAGVAGLDWIARTLAGPRGVWILPAVAAALTLVTIARNEDYRTDLALWSDTVAKRPENPFARVNLGIAQFQLGRVGEAGAQFAEAARLKPDYAAAHRNLGDALLRLGRLADAEAEFTAAIKLEPGNPDAHNALATILAERKDWAGAAEHFADALHSWPDDAAAHFRLADALLMSGRPAPAAAEFAAGLKLHPANTDAHNDWGVALLRLGRRSDARAQFQAALQLKPDDADALRNLRGTDALPP